MIQACPDFAILGPGQDAIEAGKGRERSRDEEDVAASAFDSFCEAVDRRRSPNLQDRDGLWELLLTITERKAVD